MMRDVKSMLRDYFDVMDVPDDEDGLIRFVTEKFSEQRDYYASLDARYAGHKYPDRGLVQEAIHLMDDVLSQKKDNIALIERVLKKEDALFNNKEAMSNGIENFFKTCLLYTSYEPLESAMKIRKYVKQRNVSQLPKTVQKIISDQQDEAGKYELRCV